MSKKVWILSLQAKTIYKYINDIKLCKPKEQFEELKKYLIVFDDSLEKRQIEKIYRDTCRKEMYSELDSENVYTLALINVSFSRVYPTIDTKKLRKELYENGFELFGIQYVRYKRSSGSSREGKCLFIDKRLLNKMKKWGECGLKQNGDLASWESYIALSLSSIVNTLQIPLKGILVVPDYKNDFNDDVVSIYSNGDILDSKEENSQITNDIWDGESLLDESIFEKNYPQKHMLLLRNKFFKSSAFRTKLQKWFKDNNINNIDDLPKECITFADNISDIVMVTTPNSIKYLKFKKGGLNKENIEDWFNHINDEFGVVKYDKRTRYFNGRMVQTSYQFLNTLQLTQDEVKDILEKEKEYVRLLCENIDFLRYYFTFLNNKEKIENDIEDFDESVENDLDEIEEDFNNLEEDEKIQRMSDLIFRLIDVNNDFCKTSLYKNLKKELLNSFKKNMSEGHILISGRNATLFGNGPDLLYYLAGKFDGKSITNKGTVFCKGFKNGTKLLCARSPHVTMGNLYLATNDLNDDIWNYFDLGENIVGVNAINENIQQCLNGCDYDSDFMLMTDNKLLISVAEKNKGIFKTPVCKINPEKLIDIKLFELDYNSSRNKIGEIVNLSQRLNSIIWDKYNSGASIEEIKDIYNDVCQLSILSGIEIDKAKRNYSVNTSNVISVIKNKYEKYNKPLFFKKNYNDFPEYKKQQDKKEIVFNDGKKYDIRYDYETTMDYIFKESYVSYNNSLRRKKYIDFVDMLHIDKSKINKTSYNRKDKICKLANEYYKNINNLYIEMKEAKIAEKKEIYNRITKQKKDLLELFNMQITDSSVLYLILKELRKENENKWTLLEPLLNNKYFLELINDNKVKHKHIKEDENGEYQIFHFKFTIFD